jgi:tetratricopeptide (TPR) repeat protein
MAEIALSKYCDQAKELIRTDSYDQAIAVCRHILKHYPQYVKAYRLLGEACLEKGDYVEAANFFKRVLGADMEDMVVYVGLGIIFDEQGALDEAVWQLERAFELSPGNAEIRKELQRLYGERDGTSPPKLRLTPAALGRLYLREELYQRAIDEFRDVLDADAERVDIQVALGQALWWTGQKQEAAAVCEAILEQYPNCLKANLILGEILLRGNREEEGQELLETAQALDPENSVAESLFRDKSPLQAETIFVPRLDDRHLEQEVQELKADAPSPPRGSAPGADSLAYRTSEASEEAMPDWLRRLQEEERGSSGEHVASPPDAQEMPDWLQQLAEERASGEIEGTEPGDRGPEAERTGPPEDAEFALPGEPASIEPAASRGEEGEPGAPSPAQPADWLSQLKAEGGPEEEGAPLPQAGEEETPDWLDSLRAELTEDSDALEAEREMPTWLLDLRRQTAEEEAGSDDGTDQAWGVSPADEEPRVSLQPQAAATEDKSVPAGDDLEERPQAAEEPEISQETMERLRETMPDESDSIEDIMEWMERSKALLAEEGVSEEAMEQKLERLARPPEEEEIPTWLRDLRPEIEALEEPLLGDELGAPSEEGAVPTPEEEIPTWLRDLRPSAAEGLEAVASDEITSLEEEAALPEEESASTAKETPTAPTAEEEMPSWLLEVRAEASREEPPIPSAEAEQPVEEPPAPPIEEGIPTWLRQIREEAAEELAPSTSSEGEAVPTETAPPRAAEEEVPSWLRDLRAEAAAGQTARAEEPEAGAEDLGMVAPEEKEMPSWLRQLRAEVAQQEPAAPGESPPEPTVDEAAPVPSEEEEMPSWLRQLRAEATTAVPTLPTKEPEIPGEEPPPHVVEAELPSWLQELRAEVAGEVPAPAAEALGPRAEEDAAAPVEPEEMPSWLRELRAEAEVPEDARLEEPEAPAEELPARPPEEEAVPSWLRQLRAQAEQGQTDVLMETAEAAAEEVPLPPLEAEELPTWLRELRAEAAARGPSPPPGEVEATIEEMAAEELEAWPEEEEELLPEAYEPAPVVRDEVSAPPEVTREDEGIRAAPRRDEPPAPGSAPDVYHDYLEANPRDHSVRLELARSYSQAGDLDQAAEQYAVMLSYGSMVEEVKDDLEATTESSPDHLPTQELLADAYMRTGNLQKALDKYRWLRLTLAR